MTKPVTLARPSLHLLKITVSILATVHLMGCSGGDGAPAATDYTLPNDGVIAPSVRFKGSLVTGTGVNPSDWDANTCGGTRQKNWVRSMLNEDYLFYKDAPLIDISPNTFAGSVVDLFEAYTTQGVPTLDRFSFVLTQADADATFVEGASTGVGVSLLRDATTGQLRIAFVEPSGPAALSGLRRGMQIQTIDGTALPLNTDGQPELNRAQFDALFASQAGTVVTLGVTTPPATTLSTFTVTTAKYAETPVLTTRVLEGNGVPGKVGYIAHNSYAIPAAETQLADAFKAFATAGVTDLVVDLRYNGGGYLFIASQMAYMVAGATRSTGKTFEALVFNDKRKNEDEVTPFLTTVTNFFDRQRSGEALPQLNLNRVFVLATGNTCSASEAFVSGLQGVDVEVIVIGNTTCGKPYGFSQKNNCALSYFAIEFEGRNNKGGIVPVSGIVPTCPAADDPDHELGDTAERMLASALTYAQTGSCAPATATGSAKGLGRARKPGEPIAEQEFTPLHRAIQLRLTPL